MKRILIFGIGGFAGAYLAREFHSNGYHVFGSDMQQTGSIPEFVVFRKADLLNAGEVADVIRSVKPTHIANLAAISSVGLSWKIPQKTVAVNVEGTLNLLEAARTCMPMPRVLLIGSSEEYAVTGEPINEQCELNANNPYGISKMMQEQFSRVYRERYGMRIYHVRPFNHTGIGQRDSFVIPSWCKQAAEISKSGGPGTMHVGDLRVRRDFSDVRDIVRAYRLVIESEECTQIYNIGSGRAVSLLDLLRNIISLSKQPITIEQDRARMRPTDNPVICCDNTKIKSRLGWKPEYDLFETVREMFAYFDR